MSRRGAARSAVPPLDDRERSAPDNDTKATKAAGQSRFDLVPVPSMARPVIKVARQLLGRGLTAAEVCSLFTHAACTLAQQEGGIERDEWLELCRELHDENTAADAAVNASGGSA